VTKEEYKQYLQSNHWKSFSARIKAKRKYCQHCGAEGQEVHHLNYYCLYCEVDSDVLLLCQKCHGYTHNKNIESFILSFYPIEQNFESNFFAKSTDIEIGNIDNKKYDIEQYDKKNGLDLIESSVLTHPFPSKINKSSGAVDISSCNFRSGLIGNNSIFSRNNRMKNIYWAERKESNVSFNDIKNTFKNFCMDHLRIINISKECIILFTEQFLCYRQKVKDARDIMDILNISIVDSISFGGNDFKVLQCVPIDGIWIDHKYFLTLISKKLQNNIAK